MEELRNGLPGELSLLSVWLEAGVPLEDVEAVAMRLARESAKPSYRDVLPCLYAWGRKPPSR